MVVSQEEAEVLAKRLTAGILNPPSCQIWLETTGCHFALAGVRPTNLTENASYQMLKEQISVLDGDVVLLAEKKEWVWFKSDHIPILQQQMMKQEKQEDATLLVALAKKIQDKVITREETVERVSANDFLPKPLLSKQQPQSTSQEVARQSVDEIQSGLLSPKPRTQPEKIVESQQEIKGVGKTKSEPMEQLDLSSLSNPTANIPNHQNSDYTSTRSKLNEIIRRLPKHSPIKPYGEKILKLTEKLENNTPTGITHADLTNTLQVTYDAVTYSQEDNINPQILAQKAQACADHGVKIVELSNAKISQVKKLGGLLLGIAGVLLIAASIAFAVATHFFGTPIAIAGISLGTSYIAASIGGVGLASGLIGVGLFSTRKPNEIQLQEALDKAAQETENSPKFRK